MPVLFCQQLTLLSTIKYGANLIKILIKEIGAGTAPSNGTMWA